MKCDSAGIYTLSLVLLSSTIQAAQAAPFAMRASGGVSGIARPAPVVTAAPFAAPMSTGVPSPAVSNTPFNGGFAGAAISTGVPLGTGGPLSTGVPLPSAPNLPFNPNGFNQFPQFNTPITNANFNNLNTLNNVNSLNNFNNLNNGLVTTPFFGGFGFRGLPGAFATPYYPSTGVAGGVVPYPVPVYVPVQVDTVNPYALAETGGTLRTPIRDVDHPYIYTAPVIESEKSASGLASSRRKSYARVYRRSAQNRKYTASRNPYSSRVPLK